MTMHAGMASFEMMYSIRSRKITTMHIPLTELDEELRQERAKGRFEGAMASMIVILIIMGVIATLYYWPV